MVDDGDAELEVEDCRLLVINGELTRLLSERLMVDEAVLLIMVEEAGCELLILDMPTKTEARIAASTS